MLLSYFFPPEVAAASTRVKSLVEAFTERRAKVDVIASSRLRKGFSLKTSSERHSHTVAVYRFDTFRMGFLIDPVILLFFFVRTLAIGLSRKPKVIITSVPPAELAPVAWFTSRLLRTSVIIDVRDVISPKVHKVKKINGWLFNILKHAYRHADLVTTPTDMLSAHLQSLRVRKDKIMIIRNGADIDIFHPISLEESRWLRKETNMPPDEPVLVYVADFNDTRHRLDIILESLKLLKDADHEVNLIVIGDGRYKQHFEKIAKALDLGKVKFLGKMEGSALARSISSADVGLVSYSNEEEIYLPIFPVKAYEYLACGKPVIAAMPLGGELPKFLRNKGVGLCVRPEDPVALGKSILLIKEQNHTFKSMSQNAKRISPFLDRKKQARDFVDFVLKRFPLQ